jgi:hypothetical protein
MRRVWLVPLLLVALAAGLTGCGDDDDEEASNATTVSSTTSTSRPIATSTTAESTTTSAATSATIPPAQCNPKTDPGKPALPAETFYEAWRVGDKPCAQKLGTPAAVDALFALKPNGPEWDFQGCTAGDEPDSGDCAFTYEGGATHFTIVYNATSGWSITKVFQVAD